MVWPAYCEESDGVDRLVLASLAACNADLRIAVASHVVFCGIGSVVAGEMFVCVLGVCVAETRCRASG